MKQLFRNRKNSVLTKDALLIALLISLSYFTIFYKLDSYGLYLWDEARNAVCAYEMSINGDYIVRYFDGNMDNWELKPPLLIWIQILMSKIIGFSELSIRLPSAIAALLTVLTIVYFSKRILNSTLTGFVAGLVLISSTGYVGEHVTRTGDHDSLLILFLTCIAFIFYRYISTDERNSLLLIVLSALTICAVMTKSVVGLMFYPGILLYTLYTGKLPKLVIEKNLYIGIFLFVVAIGGYYYTREIRQSGYIGVVWDNELFPRFTNESKLFYSGKWHFYLTGFIDGRFKYWIYLLIPACIITQYRGTFVVKQFQNYLLCLLSTFLIIISSGSKNFWYDAPLYPLMSLHIALGVVTAYESIKDSRYKYGFTSLFMLLFMVCYNNTLSKNHELRNVSYGVQLYKEFNSRIYHDYSINSPIKIYHYKYDASKAHLLFYSYTQPDKFNYVDKTEKLTVGDSVMFCDKKSIEDINNSFFIDTLLQHKGCVYVKLNQAKKH